MLRSKLLLALVAVVVLLVSQVMTPTLYAFSKGDVKSLYNNTPFYDPSDNTGSSCSIGTGQGLSPDGSGGKSTWNSGTQPPYYMEQFIINVLQDVAQKLGKQPSDAVTQEHVVALVAWAYAEGGNIANTGAFNLWNTGLLSRPDLIAGGTNASGLQSFKSFDAGVEGNAISFTGGYQNRVGTILVDPSSTAEQVLHAVAYYDETAGNKAWAWGNQPNDPNAVLNFNHTTYITSLLNNLDTTRSDYAHRASVVIGPGEESDHYVEATKLAFSGGTSNSPVGTQTASGGGCGANSSALSPECASATGSARILCAAKVYDPASYQETYLAGHQGAAEWHKTCTTVDESCILDCSGLVNIAIYDVFHVDLKQTTYTERSDSTDWRPIPFSEVQPGDLIQPNTGHVEIIDHVKGSTIYTFGAHTSHYPQPRQVGPSQYVDAPGNLYLHYIGPGAS